MNRFDLDISVPGDKSIAHRALMLAALAPDSSRIEGVPDGLDVRATVDCLRALGIAVSVHGGNALVEGGADRFRRGVFGRLDCANSGSTLRMLMGLCAPRVADGRELVLVGDDSLNRRPMERVAAPLRAMGAVVATAPNGCPPVVLRHAPTTRGIVYELPVASAQVKSALMLAALGSDCETRLRGLIVSRDHTERLFPGFGLRCDVSPDQITIPGRQIARAANVRVPGDVSSAAAWMVAAAGTPGGVATIRGVGLNPSRLGLARVLERMGARVTSTIDTDFPEPFGTLRVEGADLVACDVPRSEIASLVDEIPLLAVLCTRARGVSVIRGVGELRVKESDRLQAILAAFQSMGARARVVGDMGDTLEIQGPARLRGVTIDPRGDHRVAMAFAIAGLWTDGAMNVTSPDCVDVSYPGFWDVLRSVTRP